MTASIKDQIVHDFTPGRHGKIDALFDAASRLGRDARDQTLERVVRPAVSAVRHAGEVVGNRTNDASKVMRKTISDLELTTQDHPRSSLGVAFGLGLLAGIWLLSRRH